MLPARPYLLIGLALPPGTPGGTAIHDDVVTNMPLPMGVPMTELSTPDVFLLRCHRDDPDSGFQDVATYMQGKNAAHGGILLWFVQLCRTNEIAGT